MSFLKGNNFITALRSLPFKKRLLIFIIVMIMWFGLSAVLTVVYSDSVENVFQSQRYWLLSSCFVLVTSTSMFEPLK